MLKYFTRKNIYDLAIAYKWKYDQEFVELIEQSFQLSGLRTFVIGKFNLFEVIVLTKKNKISFKAFLDRASDEDPEFIPLTKLLERKKCCLINPHKKVVKSLDKVSVHKKLIRKKFQLPQTFSIQPYDKQKELLITNEELKSLGNPFIIKPATFSGGGEGVIRNATSLEQIQIERIKNHSDKYLVQEKIQPRILNERRAWFRVIYAFGQVIPTWWDDKTHIYYKVTDSEIKKYNLQQLSKISKKLARITRLDYFSTEIALTKDHKFILIDYVNDQCDMRLKSNHFDGIPDEVVTEFIEAMKKKIITL